MDQLTASPFASEADAALVAQLAAEQLAGLNAADLWDDLDEAGSWFDLDQEPFEPTGLPGEELAAGLATAARGMGQAQLSTPERAQVFQHAISPALEALGRLRADLDGVLFATAWEAWQRGLHTGVGLSLSDWLRVRCPWVSTGDAVRVRQVIQAAETHWGRPLGEALAAGQTALHRAALVARTMIRLAGSLEPDQREAYANIAIEAACNTSLTDKGLAMVCAKLLHDLLEAKDPGGADRAAHELRSVTSRKIGKGMTRFSVDAPAEESALISGILTSALAAPAPTEDGPDERTSLQRRFDALMTVLNRGLTDPGGPPGSRARTSVILTIPFDTTTGAPSGPGVTADGQIVSPTAAGLLACKGDLTPVWLSEDREPLELGRTSRYATAGQFKALVARDGHCTYPGCTVPPQWCDAHHLIWWCRDGDTDIAYLVLLCGQHHTFVHLHDLTATITGGTVTWHV